MANTILVGAQWGDEGKGKIIDVLTEQADIVVRTQGGNNAGHTVFIGKQKYVLHLVPSGILRKRKICVIGNGVVIDPVGLVEEIDGLRKLGIKADGNLFISETAHLVFPYHRELDAQREILKGKNRIGTTKRGIGPAYGDKAARTGARMIDLINPPRFEEVLRNKIKENNEILKAFGATTGRARRCGWFDAVATRQATMVNGIDELAITNVDGLDTLEIIKACVGYRIGTRRYDYVPNDIELLSKCQPIYAEFPGWRTPTHDIRHWKELPARARAYLKAIAELTGARLAIASVGPAREQTIF